MALLFLKTRIGTSSTTNLHSEKISKKKGKKKRDVRVVPIFLTVLVIDMANFRWLQAGPKVGAPNLVTSLDQTPIFEWYVVWCGSKNGYQKYEEIGYGLDLDMLTISY